MRGAELHRFTYLERLVHWLVGAAFVYLFLTGLAFSHPSLFWLTTLVGGGPAARWLHPWMGMAFSAGLVAMFFLWLRDMGLSRRDVVWFGALKHYALHHKDRVPPAGKYNSGQKLFFWVQVVFGVAHLATGVPLWFPAAFGAELLTISRLIHYAVTLGGGLFMIVHVYLGTVAFPGTARGMLHGTVTRAWAKLHHPRWYEEEVERTHEG